MTSSNVFAFDIETVPDVEFGSRLHGPEGLTDKQVGYVMQTRPREQTGTELRSLEQHRVVAISVAVRTRDGLDRNTPTLVSWNGSGFDLPVLHDRALRHGVQAHRYWEMGEQDPAFRWNNYLSRFHWGDIDLRDMLAGSQGRDRVGLDSMAQLPGRPGKPGLTGEGVWDAFLAGRSDAIRHSCETDVINEFLQAWTAGAG